MDHTADPVSQHSITPELDTYIATGPELIYQLSKKLEIDRRDAIRPVWLLTCPGTDFTPVRFTGLASAAGYITTNLPGANK